MNCKKCNTILSDGTKFCGKCGAEQVNTETPVAAKPEPKQKAFKLDMSKEANKRGLMGIGFLILLKFLGPLIGSYLIAGLILGGLFAIIDYSSRKKS